MVPSDIHGYQTVDVGTVRQWVVRFIRVTVTVCHPRWCRFLQSGKAAKLMAVTMSPCLLPVCRYIWNCPDPAATPYIWPYWTSLGSHAPRWFWTTLWRIEKTLKTTRGVSGCTLGKTSPKEWSGTGMSCPGRDQSQRSWGCLGNILMWYTV